MIESRVFSPAVIEALGYYVYLLINPDTQRIFYVGKGCGNRVFDHLKEAQDPSQQDEKHAVIRDLQRQGKTVECWIHRHGLNEREAFEVEAALIDLLEVRHLTNRVRGQHAHARGPMTVGAVMARYDAPPAIIHEPVVLITINRRYYDGIGADELYECTRKSWKINPLRRHPPPCYAFAVFRGIVRQVYRITEWYRPEESPSRWAFTGAIADDLQHYVGTSVAQYVKPGAQSPTLYVNC